MTPQEAIDVLERERNKSHWDSLDELKQASDAWKMAIEALKRQIPKKPIRINKNKEFDGNWKKICPSCGRMLIERITTPEKSFPRHYNYTQHCWCGQAIDWSE